MFNLFSVNSPHLLMKKNNKKQMLCLCLVSGSRHLVSLTFKWWPKERIMQLLFAEPGTMAFSVCLLNLVLPVTCYQPLSQPLSHSLKVSATYTSFWGITVCRVSSSSFIRHLGEHKRYVVASSYLELLARGTRPSPETQIEFKTKSQKRGRWRSRLRAKKATGVRWHCGWSVTPHRLCFGAKDTFSSLFGHAILSRCLCAHLRWAILLGEEAAGVLCHWLR